MIRQIGDKECQMVLVLKFIRYMQMTDIAEKMNMDRTTVYRKYKKGIELAQEILSDSDKKLALSANGLDLCLIHNYKLFCSTNPFISCVAGRDPSR